MKKIMFNDRYGLTQAVLEGRKSMTRRIVPKRILDAVSKYQEEYFAGALETISTTDAIMNMVTCEHMFNPPYKVGEIVAIAQRYRDIMDNRKNWDFLVSIGVMRETDHWIDCWMCESAGFSNKMFVKPELMPHRIRITGFHCEYLREISNEDCMKEGIVKNHEDGYNHYPYVGKTYFDYSDPREAFSVLIDNVSGKGTWDSNPLVFAYEFELVD